MMEKIIDLRMEYWKILNMSAIKSQRIKLGMNQTVFWSRVGVTQSGGARYEGERRIPKPVRMLLAIAYGTKAERERTLKGLTI